jgi:hypothetical protein
MAGARPSKLFMPSDRVELRARSVLAPPLAFASSSMRIITMSPMRTARVSSR